MQNVAYSSSRENVHGQQSAHLLIFQICALSCVAYAVFFFHTIKNQFKNRYVAMKCDKKPM